MSREELITAEIVEEQDLQLSPEDVRLQIDLRLRLNEVVDAEAQFLGAQATRPPTGRELSALAGRIYDARRARDRVFDPKLFGEPAWDMLLALYCLPPRGEMLTTTGLAHASGVPVTTAYRWQKILNEKGLIERGPEQIDRRRQMIRLTRLGRVLLERYLTKLFYHASPKRPVESARDAELK